ncbi:MAG: DbpA RNA binding domain-containing protein, partial [Hafnia sp.]
SDLDKYRDLLTKLQPEDELDMETLAAALLKMAQGERPLILPPDPVMERRPRREFRDRDDRNERGGDRFARRGDREPREAREGAPRRERRDAGDMELYRIEVGRDDGVEVRHIVGAIANEGDISSRYIGNIKLFASHSTIELPKGMPGDLLSHFTRTRILNKPLNMQLMGDAPAREPRRERPAGDRGRSAGGERRSFGGRDGAPRRDDRRGNSDRSAAPRGPRRDDAAQPPRRRTTNDA